MIHRPLRRYPLGCKRPCIHDDFLPTFNRPNVTLVDTHGVGVQRIVSDGPVVAGETHKLDVLIYATGFDFCKVRLSDQPPPPPPPVALTPTRRARIP